MITPRRGERRGQRGGEHGLHLPWGIVVQVVGWIVAALWTYSAINARIAVVEDRVDAIRVELQRIRDDHNVLLRNKQ